MVKGKWSKNGFVDLYKIGCPILLSPHVYSRLLMGYAILFLHRALVSG